MKDQFITITGFGGLALKQAFEQGQAAKADDTNPYATTMPDGNGKEYCPMAGQRDAWFLGTVNDVATMQDIIDRENADNAKALADRIAEKGHNCDEHVVHKFDGNDYYECGQCGELLQVG